MIVIDADGAIVGRLSAYASKRALEGDEVAIVNVEKAVISGDPDRIISIYMKRREMQNKGDPNKSPSQGWAKRPDKLFKRIMTGMMPKHSKRAKEALARVMAYIGTPSELEGKAKPFGATSKKLSCEYISLKQICSRLGWNQSA